MLSRIRNKIRSNLQLYKKELQAQGLSYVLTARVIKFPLTRLLYNAFKPESEQVGNHRMFIDKHDMIVSQVLYTKHVWDPYTSSIFLKVLKKNDVFLDIGAHIGYYTLLGADIVEKNGQVYAFEPDEISSHLLQKNITVNNYSQVTIVKKAVSDSTGKKLFYLNRENTGDNKLINDGSGNDRISVATVKLDDFFPELKVKAIKMDIQGAEIKALRGMSKLLDNNPLCRILIEFWPEGLKKAGGSDRELLTLLSKRSYNFLLVDEDRKQTRKITSDELLQAVSEGKLYDTNLLCYKKNDSTFPLEKLTQ